MLRCSVNRQRIFPFCAYSLSLSLSLDALPFFSIYTFRIHIAHIIASKWEKRRIHEMK